MSDDVASGGHCREKVGRGEGEICIWAGAGQTRTWHLLWLHQIRLAQTPGCATFTYVGSHANIWPMEGWTELGRVSPSCNELRASWTVGP